MGGFGFYHGLLEKRDNLKALQPNPDEFWKQQPYATFLKEFNIATNGGRGGVEAQANACTKWFQKWEDYNGGGGWAEFVKPWSFFKFSPIDSEAWNKQKLDVLTLDIAYEGRERGKRKRKADGG